MVVGHDELDAPQATIGEDVSYTVTVRIPAGTTLYDAPALADPYGARLGPGEGRALPSPAVP